ncbi:MULTISPECIES: hypothetical protein [unclassified Fusibacter]|uniref:hypothetical protein n=1 Tax=unclassified Fusibacter TaxID=2624464 RepID=UPI001012470E|nr:MULTISPECIES: hypothetical protein [unclassified Fusibacter]MCK8058937.1 hypothetical protein [Fusibacter sp. A2]NPE22013.1 hypothetical protein [Fusibacter sp. A1]RXV61578.1 hypothetical protein DWB64_09220 [Fusibacter sp. A1]
MKYLITVIITIVACIALMITIQVNPNTQMTETIEDKVIVSNEAVEAVIIDPYALDHIKFELVEYSQLPEGNVYTVQLKNESKHTIVQNNVYLYYPIITGENSRTTNKCKVEMTGNKLNIAPGESVLLTAFYPKDNFVDQIAIASGDPELEIQGYLNELSIYHHFGKMGAIFDDPKGLINPDDK